MRSEQKVVVITGGSSGIGKALVFKYAKEGYAVVFTGRDKERMNEVSKLLGDKKHLPLVLDASNESDNQKMVELTIDRFGRIDVLICNAGISMRALFEEVDLAVFKELMDINFYGTIYAVKYSLKYILETKGTIIGISSINGWRSTPARTAYSASKFAVQGFFEALRTEVMTRGVHVLVVCPGFTASNIRNVALNAKGEKQKESPRDEKKMMTAEHVAFRTFKAAKRRKRDLILTSKGKMAVFLNKIFPSFADKIVLSVMKKEPNNPLK